MVVDVFAFETAKYIQAIMPLTDSFELLEVYHPFKSLYTILIIAPTRCILSC